MDCHEFCSDIPNAQMMNYNDFGSLLSFHLAPSTGQNSYVQFCGNSEQYMIGYDR